MIRWACKPRRMSYIAAVPEELSSLLWRTRKLHQPRGHTKYLKPEKRARHENERHIPMYREPKERKHFAVSPRVLVPLSTTGKNVGGGEGGETLAISTCTLTSGESGDMRWLGKPRVTSRKEESLRRWNYGWKSWKPLPVEISEFSSLRVSLLNVKLKRGLEKQIFFFFS